MNDQNQTDLELESLGKSENAAKPLRKARRELKDLKKPDSIATEEISEEHVIVQEIQIPEEVEEEISLPSDLKISKDSAPFIPKKMEETASEAIQERQEINEAADGIEALEVPESNAADSPFETSFQKFEEPQQAPVLSPAANAFDWFKTFLLSLTAVIFIFTLIFRGVTVNGDSMLPTLHNNEYLIISDLIYTPKTGDIVVVQSPHFKNGTEPLIKRVIATEGQEVTINFSTWKITVDGKELKEDYIQKDVYSTMRSEDMIPDEKGEVHFTVEDNSIFVMGDNRNDSLDSRSEAVGQIDERYIMGRVLLRITPFDRFGKVN